MLRSLFCLCQASNMLAFCMIEKKFRPTVLHGQISTRVGVACNLYIGVIAGISTPGYWRKLVVVGSSIFTTTI